MRRLSNPEIPRWVIEKDAARSILLLFPGRQVVEYQFYEPALSSPNIYSWRFDEFLESNVLPERLENHMGRIVIGEAKDYLRKILGHKKDVRRRMGRF